MSADATFFQLLLDYSHWANGRTWIALVRLARPTIWRTLMV